ncbi:hypothetical protein CSW78_28055 [Shigella flexneri]|nr:hypothetical protein CSW78_28055 [Shigella flexneri]
MKDSSYIFRILENGELQHLIKQKIKIENLSIENFTRVIGDFTIQEDEIELAPYSIVILKK